MKGRRSKSKHKIVSAHDDPNPPKLTGEFRVGDKVKYQAVDLDGVRYRLGEHIVLWYSNREWVARITDLWMSTVHKTPYMRHTWFWTPYEIRLFDKSLRCIEYEKHELLLGTNTDMNPVATILRKCTVLSRDTFRQVFHGLSPVRRKKLSDVFFCNRKFDQLDWVVKPLGNVLFPGDSIPTHVMRIANIWRKRYEVCKVITDMEEPYDEECRPSPITAEPFEYSGVYIV